MCERRAAAQSITAVIFFLHFIFGLLLLLSLQWCVHAVMCVCVSVTRTHIYVLTTFIALKRARKSALDAYVCAFTQTHHMCLDVVDGDGDGGGSSARVLVGPHRIRN